MLEVLMLDFGDTLVHADQVYPGVKEALEAFRELKTADSQPLNVCLISDYHLMDSEAPREELDRLVEEYISILDAFGLTPYFEPTNKRVTLSTHAGIHKPDRRVFERALQRLGTSAELSECVFITENGQHVESARALGIDALHFDPDGSGDFSDWSEAPLLIAHRLGHNNAYNLEIALGAYLRVTHQAELIKVEQIQEDRVRVRVKSPCRLSDSRLGDLDGVYVSVPLEAQIELNRDGTAKKVEIASLSPTDKEEILSQVMSLKEHGQIGPSASHDIEVDSLGHRRLVRKRFEQWNH